ncbi:hypothetical protein BGZ59_010844 [Podila verticillata]|nr:hypothetical protein BGZ59_010844 [Podila verticillata]
MFSTPKASTADIDCNGSHLPHESGLSQGKQGKGRRRKNNKLHNNSTLSVAVLQSSLVPVSPSSELSDNKLEELPWDIPSQERSCSPATPLPTERTVFDAFTPLACPPDGSCTLAKLNDNVQSTTPTDVDTTLEPTPTGPITPRSRPKPSPIATKALHRSTSLSHSATINSLIPEPNEGGPHSSDNSAGNIINEGLFDHDCPSGRDSGIAIDSWGPSLETDKDLFKGPKDPFPSFDQLFQPSDFGTDPFQAELVWEKRARQRCRSMVHPSTLRHQSSSEDHLSRSDIELSTLNTTSTNKSGVTKKVRSKRVASMSFVSGPDGTKHFADMLSSHHDLPPKPPTNGANCSSSSSAGTKSSFFHTPHSGDSSQGRDQAGYFNKQHNRSTSLSSSSRSSSVSGTIPLSRSPSPPIHHPNVMPFSSMLDLATAKAENITGLYFAKQMNMKSVSCLHPVPQGLERSISDHSESDITIKVNSPSPIANAKHAKEATEVPSLRSGPLFEGDLNNMSTIAPLLDSQEGLRERRRRSRSSTSGESFSEFSFPPRARASTPCDTNSTLAPKQPPSTPLSQSIKGQHRRSQSASHFFHLSSLKHHSPAQFNLALCYEHGQGGVDRDLEKALYFYQQAADQGHTKASYNLGCICYNLGQAGKAIAWFESAGKCSIRGLQSIINVKPHGAMDCPLPKKLSGGGDSFPDNELADMLRGDHMATSGPFAPYLPAILCLSLLCRQGVQTREGDLVLKKDQAQAVELLKDLVGRAPPSLASRNNSTISSGLWTQEPVAHSSFSLGSTGHDKDGSSLLSTSCPSLTTCSSPEDGVGTFLGTSQRSRRSHAPTVETVEGDEDNEVCEPKHPRMLNQHLPAAQRSSLSSPELGDMHETWAVTLSQHLLKTWTSPKTSSGATCPPPIADKTQQRILRHHLLYITNPTHGKNLYNLGVLYDLYLQDPGVAVKCYRTAYHNSVNPISTANSNCETSSSANLVTRINSSWNLGVLHVKNKEWQQAQEWFLRAQQDVHLYENVREKECVRSKPVAGNDKVEKGPVLSALEKMSEVLAKTSFSGSNDRVGEGQRPKVDTRTVRKRSLVNVVPHDQAASPPLPSDSPARIHAREHGLMMHLGSLPMPGSSSTSQRLSNSKRDKSPSNAMPTQNKTENREGIRTDANKISWVLRWVESNMNSSK